MNEKKVIWITGASSGIGKALALIVLIILILLIIILIIRFKRVNFYSYYLMIPYLLWCLFALLLNVSLIILN